MSSIHFIHLCFFAQVAIKTLIVLHRTLREGDPTFREELLNYSYRGHILQISNFKDDSSPLGKLFLLKCWIIRFSCFLFQRRKILMIWTRFKQDNTSTFWNLMTFLVSLLMSFCHAAWDCSAWVRTYALFLEERLECFRILKYDIESEKLTKTSPGASKVCFLFQLGLET